MKAVPALIIVVALLAFARLATLDTTVVSESHPLTSFNAEQIADCIAEQTYTHPQKDRFAELVTALQLCRPVLQP